MASKSPIANYSGVLQEMPAADQLPAANLPAASDTASGAIEIAVQSEMEAGSDLVRAVVPGRQQFHPSAVKAWASFGAPSGAAGITASYNFSSVTDNGVGDYSLNFTNAQSSTAYAVGGLVTSTEANSISQLYALTKATGSVRVLHRNAINVGIDAAANGCSVIVTGDL